MSVKVLRHPHVRTPSTAYNRGHRPGPRRAAVQPDFCPAPQTAAFTEEIGRDLRFRVLVKCCQPLCSKKIHGSMEILQRTCSPHFIECASDKNCVDLEQSGFPRCFSPHPATPTAMVESANFKYRVLRNSLRTQEKQVFSWQERKPLLDCSFGLIYSYSQSTSLERFVHGLCWGRLFNQCRPIKDPFLFHISKAMELLFSGYFDPACCT